MKNITFINAGAGSGKTYRLMEPLVEWIESGNDGSRILMTTFTKKAAAEVRSRAEQALLKAERFEDIDLLKSATMGTVHSVGHQFIMKYWYLLELPPEVKQLSERERAAFFERSIANIPTSEELTLL